MARDWKQDAGHGGSDPGAVANGQQEKEWTLEASIYVDKRLGDHGIKSTLTRIKDVTLAENTRVNTVSRADKCISHHYNAGGGAGAEFIHSIYSDGKFEKLLEDEFRKAGYPVRRTFDRKGSNGKDYYYMHRRTGSCRTTIVEYDFLDGPNFNKLKSKSYREGMYECVVKAICRDEGIKYKPLKSSTKPSSAKPKTVQIKTGGLNDQNLIRVINYFQDRGWWGQVTIDWDKGNPTVTSGGLNATSQKEYEAWLKKQGWYYKVL